jgi:hypothetical protein
MQEIPYTSAFTQRLEKTLTRRLSVHDKQARDFLLSPTLSVAAADY